MSVNEVAPNTTTTVEVFPLPETDTVPLTNALKVPVVVGPGVVCVICKVNGEGAIAPPGVPTQVKEPNSADVGVCKVVEISPA